MKPDLIHLRGRRVCVALSGGGDSVALFHFLCGCARENGIELSAVHVEHGIRGEASRADAGFVRALCAARGVPLREVSEDVPARAAAWKAGLEEAARRCRYAAFARLLAAGEADVVATAHHAGDNAESVLFNLLRGSSLTGAGGIRAFLPYPALARLAGEDLSAGEGLPPRPAYCGVARPLLSVSQGEIAAYLRENALAFREDATNADTAYTRNFLRARVLAPARERFPAAERALYNFSRRAREDDDYLYSLAREKVACSVREGVPAAEVPADLPRPLFVRACALALRALGAERDCTSADFEAAFALTRGGSGRTACLPRGVRALREYEKVILYRPAPASLAAAGSSSAPGPSAPAAGSLQYPFAEGEFPFAGAVLRVRRAGREEAENVLRAAGEAENVLRAAGKGRLRPLVLDAARLPDGCVLRTRREGDRFQKFGGGSKKLKDFFIDRKLPRPLRASLPLLACGGEVFAVCGVEIAEKVRLTSAPAQPYILELILQGEQ